MSENSITNIDFINDPHQPGQSQTSTDNIISININPDQILRTFSFYQTINPSPYLSDSVRIGLFGIKRSVENSEPITHTV
ncbi:hypothetical protein D3C85_1722890 [compost metagenome]